MSIAEVNVAKLQPNTDDFDIFEFQAAINPLIDRAGGRRIFRGLLGQVVEGFPLRDLEPTARYVMNITVWSPGSTFGKFMEDRSNVRKLLSYQHLFARTNNPAPLAFWIVEAGATPTIEEAAAKLQYLRDNGPTELAFDSKNRSVYAPNTS